MADGIRLRETNGTEDNKRTQALTGAWREPKVLIVYVVDAEGKREARFAPFIDATLKGPDAVFALLRSYLQRLEITQADQVLFIADRGAVDMETGPVARQSVRLSRGAGA